MTATRNPINPFARLTPRALKTRTGRRSVVVAYYALLPVMGLCFGFGLDWLGIASLYGLALCLCWLYGLSSGGLNAAQLDERQQLERLKIMQGAFTWVTGVVFLGWVLLTFTPYLNIHLRVDLKDVFTFLFAGVAGLPYALAAWSTPDPLQSDLLEGQS